MRSMSLFPFILKRLVIHLFILLWGNLKKYIIQLNRIYLDEWTINFKQFKSPGILSWWWGVGVGMSQEIKVHLGIAPYLDRICQALPHIGMGPEVLSVPNKQRWYQVSSLGLAQPFCLKTQNLSAHTVSICSEILWIQTWGKRISLPVVMFLSLGSEKIWQQKPILSHYWVR